MKVKHTTWIMLPILTLCLDLASKIIVTKFIPLHSTYIIIPGFFSLTVTHNYGAIFGFMSEAPLFLRTIIFTLSGLIALIYFSHELLKNDTSRIQRTAIGCILGGTAGNSIDRIQHGSVVDFLDFTFYGWHYWTFNLADSFIVCGIAILVLSYLPNTKICRTKVK